MPVESELDATYFWLTLDFLCRKLCHKLCGSVRADACAQHANMHEAGAPCACLGEL